MRANVGLLLASISLCSSAASAQSSAPPPPSVAAPVRACASLADLDLSGIGGAGSRIVSASETTSRDVAVCAVEGMLAPSIGFRVELPLAKWTQRYLQVGCGGYCGRISLNVRGADGCLPLAAGEFVMATTDMGHQGRGTAFGRDPQMRADFAHRAIGVTARAAKALIRAFYGRSPARSYFSGCSRAGDRP